jgi:hypothetical protein
MTLSEFKAWFSGYTEDMDKPPTAKQWKRIQKVVKDIDGDTVTERIYLDRYWPGQWQKKWGWSYTGDPVLYGTTTLPNFTTSSGSTSTVDAMYAAGKAEAQEYSI